MAHKIMKSAIDGIPDFAVKVAAHAREMRDWRAHMGRVAADEMSGVPREDAHHPFPAPRAHQLVEAAVNENEDRKSTRLNSSHQIISYAVFCLKKKKKQKE